MSERLKITRGSGNVFRDLGFPPEEAQNLLLRSDLMTRIERFVKTSGLKRKNAAARRGVMQPRLNDLLKGKIEKFSLDALANVLGRAGIRIELSVKKAA